MAKSRIWKDVELVSFAGSAIEKASVFSVSNIILIR